MENFYYTFAQGQRYYKKYIKIRAGSEERANAIMEQIFGQGGWLTCTAGDKYFSAIDMAPYGQVGTEINLDQVKYRTAPAKKIADDFLKDLKEHVKAEAVVKEIVDDTTG